jgi:hypothetical protein
MWRYPEDDAEVEGVEGMLSRLYRGTTADSQASSPLLNRFGNILEDLFFGQCALLFFVACFSCPNLLTYYICLSIFLIYHFVSGFCLFIFLGAST